MNYFIDLQTEKVILAPPWREMIDEFKGLPNWCKANEMNYVTTYSTEAMFESIDYKEYEIPKYDKLTPYGIQIAKDRIKAEEILKRLNITNYRKDE